MKTYLTEEISRIKQIMGIITESEISLPIKISGEYRVPDNISNKGDALHSFNKRKSDGFGGYMLKGNPPSEWSQYITLNQGMGINQALEDVWRKGVNPDVTDLIIDVDSRNLIVKWSAIIDESKDGNAYVGMSSVGSAGQDADNRAQSQIDKMKTWVKGAQDYTIVLDFKNTSGIYIRQDFYKWTNPKTFPPNNGNVTITKNDDIKIDDDSKTIDTFFKDWKPGEYKLSTDKLWTYKLTDDKQWEAKKPGGDYINLKSTLSDENYNKALNILKNSTMV